MFCFERMDSPSFVRLSELWKMRKELLSYGINWTDNTIGNVGVDKKGNLRITDTGYLENMTCYKNGNKRKLNGFEKKLFGVYRVGKKVDEKLDSLETMDSRYDEAINDKLKLEALREYYKMKCGIDLGDLTGKEEQVYEIIKMQYEEEGFNPDMLTML